MSRTASAPLPVVGVTPPDRLPSSGSSTSLVPVYAVAALLLLVCMLPYLIWEQLVFDSDQAILGLMAKHLSEGRAFPLFFYGQTYMLGVEAWAMVPFFLVAGPTVFALRCSLLAWNIAFAILLVKGFHAIGLRRWVALVPALFFIVAPPSVNAMFASARGIIEPFVYVGILWLLRDRPLWFGVVLGIGFLNREFTFYAIPVLLALQVLTGELTWTRIRGWAAAAVMFLFVLESVEALKRVADLSGPGTRGQLLGGFSGSQVGNLLGRFNWRPGELVARVTTMMPEIGGWFIGARQIDSDFPVPDRRWVLWIAAAFVAASAARLAWLIARERPTDQIRRGDFAFYVLGIGIVAAAAFVAGKPFVTGYVRYGIMGLLVPVGLTAALLALERRIVVQRIVVAAVVAWAALAVADHTRVLATYLRHPPDNPAREIADRLRARGADVAEAQYWQAYRLSFLTRERVRVASRDFVRIDEYQELARARGDLIEIREKSCPGGELVGGLYLCQEQR